MKKEPKEILITWLRDAHAMEKQLLKNLEKQSDRLGEYPAVQRRVAEHAEETRRHAERLESCLEGLGSDTSTFKDLMAKMGGASAPMGLALSPDEPVKATLTNIAAEHFEIACYRSLGAAAEACGEATVAAVARQNLADEEAMARFLEESLPETTRTYLAHQTRTS
jgi:ferritin-like metal-binding protein YciE